MSRYRRIGIPHTVTMPRRWSPQRRDAAWTGLLAVLLVALAVAVYALVAEHHRPSPAASGPPPGSAPPPESGSPPPESGSPPATSVRPPGSVPPGSVPPGSGGASPGGWPSYASAVAPVSAARLGASWHPGCPVPPGALRLVTVRYAGFDGRAHDGQLVVAADLAGDVRAIFGRLYALRFPIRSVRTVEGYRASDDASMAADNTSAFNCRPVTGGAAWSTHAYGRAVDLNPRENPYVHGGTVLPPDAFPRGRPSTAPASVPGVVTARVVAAFGAYHWSWGGTWTDPVDYQHFERAPGGAAGQGVVGSMVRKFAVRFNTSLA
jgi:D-alanyl-D-alanine carboxypeptidase